MAIDYTTDAGQVRLLIPDLYEDVDADAAQLFTDAQIAGFLDIASDNVKRSAAQAKLVLATSQNLLLKYVKDHDLILDGPKVAAELRAEAKELYELAELDDATEMANVGLTITVVDYDFEENPWDSTTS